MSYNQLPCYYPLDAYFPSAQDCMTEEPPTKKRREELKVTIIIFLVKSIVLITELFPLIFDYKS